MSDSLQNDIGIFLVFGGLPIIYALIWGFCRWVRTTCPYQR